MNDYSDEQWNAMIDLLTYVAAADRRTIGDTDVRVWLDGAADGQWPSIQAALRAVRLHRREQPGKWLEPGHVSCILDRVREEARRSYQAPKDQDIPEEILDDPAKYQRYMRAAVEAHQSEAMAAFVRGESRVAIEAAS